VNARIDAARKDTSDQIVGLRRAVIEYHSAVLGHRVEQHIGLRLSTRLARG